MTAEEYLQDKGYASWYTDHGDDTGETVISYQDCLQAMDEYTTLKLDKLKAYVERQNSVAMHEELREGNENLKDFLTGYQNVYSNVLLEIKELTKNENRL